MTTAVSRAQRWLLGAAGLVLVVGVVAAVRIAPPPGERAVALLDEPSHFASTTKAVDALLEAADLATQELARCREGEGRPAPTCIGWGSAAAYARVGASVALQCTAPGRERVRRAVHGYFTVVASLTSDAAAVPDPPPVPTCR